MSITQVLENFLHCVSESSGRQDVSLIGRLRLFSSAARAPMISADMPIAKVRIYG